MWVIRESGGLRNEDFAEIKTKKVILWQRVTNEREG